MTARHDGQAHSDPFDQAGAWCLRLAEGALSAQERIDLEAWLAADAANAQALDAAARAWQALDQARLSPELIAMRRSALDSFRRGHANRWREGAGRWRSVAALAACLAVAAVAAGLWLHLAPRSFETGVGERRIVALSDGSRISLDAASRVKVRYRDNRRELWLEHGRAKFAVARDPLRPFSVAAADKLVVATGTEFSVELLASQVHVILYKGSVEVLSDVPGEKGLRPLEIERRPGDRGKPVVAALVPGNELVAGTADSKARMTAADTQRSLSWETGQLSFSNETLSSAVERMNRYVNSPLSVGDAAAGQVLISGVFAAGDTEAFIEGVTGVFPVRVHEEDGRKVLVSAQ